MLPGWLLEATGNCGPRGMVIARLDGKPPTGTEPGLRSASAKIKNSDQLPRVRQVSIKTLKYTQQRDLQKPDFPFLVILSSAKDLLLPF